ncbi:methyltransferase domain-containing protein [Patescibacteria group bacterium]|nr:methyltransferase domain-containing protein [Patescibacteria group bacterium]
MNKTNFTKISQKSAVSVNQLVVEKPLFSVLGNLSGKKVLDLGCGNGYYSRQFAKKGAQVIGVDINPANIQKARKTRDKNTKFLIADITKYKSTSRFDIAIAIFVLNELSKNAFKRAIKNIVANLRKGGRLVFVVPHPLFAYMEQTDLIYRKGLGNIKHTKEGLQYKTQITLSDGSKIIAHDYYHSLGFILDTLRENNFGIFQFKELSATEGKHPDYSSFSYYLMFDVVLLNNRNEKSIKKLPEIQIIQGFKSVKSYYYSINKILLERDEVLVFGARSGDPRSKQAVDFFVDYMKDRVKKNIKTRLIFNKDVEQIAKIYAKMPLTEVRYMPEGLITLVSINIYNDTIDMLDWAEKEPRVIVIHDKKMAESYRDYFNLLWSSTNLIEDLIIRGRYWLPEILFEDFIRNTNEKENVESKILELIINKKPRILQIGSGLGGFIQNLNRISGRLTLLEKNRGYTKLYPKSNKIEIINKGFEETNLKEKFDYIIVSHVMYYFANYEEIIDKMLSSLDKNGKIIFVVNSPIGDYKLVKDFFFKLRGKKYIYTYDKLTKLFKQKRLKVNEYKVDCEVSARDADTLYKNIRFWFEMDLRGYFENEQKIEAYLKNKIRGNKLNFQNSILVVYK